MPKEFASWILGFGRAIGEGEERVTRLQLHNSHIEMTISDRAHGRSGLAKGFSYLAQLNDQRRFMSAIGIHQLATLRIQDAKEERGKHPAILVRFRNVIIGEHHGALETLRSEERCLGSFLVLIIILVCRDPDQASE